MKADKYVFKRYEIKYKLTPRQFAVVSEEVSRHLAEDEYGMTTIQSLYYDTDTRLLVRNSIEKPFFKEKLRARSYGPASPDKDVFLEIKRKCDDVVFKRRIAIREKNLSAFVDFGIGAIGQIENEIRYLCRFYGGLKPSMLLLYDRTAYYDKNSGSDLRITFDRNIRYRTRRLDLCSELDGTLLLPDGEILMEVKTGGGYPVWLINLLDENGIYKTSFSKYGTAYLTELQSPSGQNNYIYTEEKAV